MRTHILVTDDEPLTRRSLQEILRYEGYNVSTAENGTQALEILKQYKVDILMTDIKMPKLGGFDLLKQVKEYYPSTQVVMMSAYSNVENAVEAMRLGAYDYLSKPLDDEQIRSLIFKIERELVKNSAEKPSAETSLSAVPGKRRQSDQERERFYTMLGKDEKMQRIYSIIDAIADSPSTVLVCGESGTGKRMTAMAIHQADSSRRDKPFIEISCGALPETLLESELFGHVKGAFTGAIKDRPGRFELADGGTLLLDEIDTCSPSLQVKLLRVLEEGLFERVGDTVTRKADVRIIAATNQRLEELVARRSFREDLFWRLNVICINLPPLRERQKDIPLLSYHFLEKYNRMRKNTKNVPEIKKISDDAMLIMSKYQWPGNIRELENTMERACILVRNTELGVKDLPDSIFRAIEPKTEAQENDLAEREKDFSLKTALRSPEKDILLNALEHTSWNCTRAAAYLGINRTTLYNKMKLFGIKRKNSRD